MIADFDLDLIGRLQFVVKKRRQSGFWGERRSTRRGRGMEFSDYRDYAPGDDPRSVDWNLYARLDRPYVRLFEEEQDLVTAVLIDGSGSMEWNEAFAGRWHLVRQLAVALGGIALMHGDTLYGSLLGSGETNSLWGPTRGRGFFMLWQEWVRKLKPHGDSSLVRFFEDYAHRVTRPSLTLVLTDGYDIEGLTSGIAGLAASGHEIVILHILTPEELTPSLRGDVRLIDAETGSRREVSIDGAVLAIYQQKLDQWCRSLQRIAAKHAGRYVMLRADYPLRRLLLEDLRYADVLH
jgi:uncharacterized protein (DUF58 family)